MRNMRRAALASNRARRPLPQPRSTQVMPGLTSAISTALAATLAMPKSLCMSQVLAFSPHIRRWARMDSLVTNPFWHAACARTSEGRTFSLGTVAATRRTVEFVGELRQRSLR